MEASENRVFTFEESSQNTSVVSNNNTGTDEVPVSPERKKRKGSWPATSGKVLHNWLFEHRFQGCPSEAEKRMLSEQTGLSSLQITNWFIEARRRILPEMLPQSGDDLTNITIYHQKGNNANVTHRKKINQSSQAKSGPAYLEENQCPPLSPLPTSQESEGQPLDPEVAGDQKFNAKSEEKVQISTSRPSFMFSPKPGLRGDYTDFSDFQLLVDVAVQKAAELELQKK